MLAAAKFKLDIIPRFSSSAEMNMEGYDSKLTSTNCVFDL